ncbi:MAG: hypothetical protein HYU63_09195 [Armatimonadetes bacterium]|nr:hypothetical protein [Armatimonadota bacterium]
MTNLDNKTHFSPLLTSQKIGNYLPDSIENKNNIYQTPSNISINRKEILLQTPNLIQTQTSH